MALRLIPLEKRILFDASVAALVVDAAQTAAHASTEPIPQPPTADHQSTPQDQTATSQQAAAPPPAIDPNVNSDSGIHVLVVSNQIPQLQEFLASVSPKTLVVMYDEGASSLTDISNSIARVLNGRTADTIGFASHSDAGALILTKDVSVTKDSLTSNAMLRQFWQDVGSMMQSGGRVDFLSCNLAVGDNSELTALDTLLDGTNGDRNISLAASSQLVGSAKAGASWFLDYGGVDVTTTYFTPMILNWDGVLDGIVDIDSGASSSNPSGFTQATTSLGTYLFFTATTKTSGTELYALNSAGTVTLIQDIFSGISSSNPNHLVAFNNRLYFLANDFVGSHLYSTLGPGSGASQVTLTGVTGTVTDLISTGSQLIAVRNSGGSFALYDISNTSSPVAYSGSYTGVANLYISSGDLFFAGTTAALGSELYRANANQFTPLLIGDINPSTASSSPANFAVLNGYLYFAATDTTNGRELWALNLSDNSFSNVVNLNTGAANSNPSQLTVFQNRLYWVATDSIETTLFSLSSPSSSTIEREIPSTSGQPGPTSLLVVGDFLFAAANTFSGTTGNTFGSELYKTNGDVTQWSIVRNINTTASAGSTPGDFTLAGNKLYFTASATGVAAAATLWVSDGTTAGTVSIPTIGGVGVSSVTSTFKFNNWIVGEGASSPTGSELYLYTIPSNNTVAPVGANKSYSAIENTGTGATLIASAANGLLVGATDADGTSSFAARLNTYATHGDVVINPNGSFSYIPDDNFVGTDTFTYRIDDGTLRSAPITVTITVTPPTDLSNVPIVVYSENFQDIPNVNLSNYSTSANAGAPAAQVNSTLTITSAQPASSAAEKFLGLFGAQSVNFNLAGISTPHNYLSVSFDLIIQGSWDGVGGSFGQYGGSYISVLVNGSPVLLSDFANDGVKQQSFPNNSQSGLTSLSNTGATAVGSLGFTTVTGGVTFSDVIYHLTYLIPTASSSISLAITGLERQANPTSAGIPTENNWALDNVSVSAYAAADLQTTINYTSSQYLAGSTASFNVVLANNGPYPSSGSTLQLTSPLAITAGTLPSGVTFDATTKIITVGTLAANSSLTLPFTEAIPSNYSPTSLSTTVEVITANEGDSNSTPNNHDPSENDQATATVSVNAAPTGVNDSYTTLEDATLSITTPGVLSNDSDVNVGDTLTATLVANAAHGNVILNSDGSFVFVPAANYNGSDSFTYQVFDNHGVAGNIVTVNLSVTAVNDVPSFSLSTTSVTSLEDAGAQTVTGVATGMSAGPSNESAQTLNFIVTTNNPSLFSVAPAINATTGNLTYTAAANANGTATVSIQLHDNGGTTNGGVDTSAIQALTINVTAVNDVPSFSLSTSTITSLEDAGAQTVNGVATGMSAGPSNESSQTLNFIVTTNNPSLFSAGPAIDPITGNLTYTAAANANGTATVSIQLHDNGGTTNGGVDTSAIQTLTINVTAVNDVPSFSLSTTTITSLEDAGAQTVTGLATGISAGASNESSQTLNFIVTTNNPSLFSAGPAIDPITGNLTYTAAANANGTATVSIQLHDNAGTANGGVDTSAIQTLTINVTAVNDVPSFSLSTGTVTSLEDAGAQTVTGVATGISAGPSNESSQTLNFIVTTNNPSLFSAGPAISPTGNLTYTTAANANGTATVSIQLHDNAGTANGGVDTSAIQTLTINVTAVNDVPSFSLSTTTINSLEDAGAQTVTGVATGMSAGPSNESSQILNFIVTTNNPSLFSAGPAINPVTGNLTYTAAANANGTATVSIQLHDNGGTTNSGVDTSAIQTLTITVTAVNDVPSFSLSTTTVTSLEDAGAQTVTGVATGMSAGPSNESSQTLNFTVTTNNPSLFSAGPAIDPITGNLTYTAAANANGTATVSIQLHDNGGTTNGGVDTSAIQTLTINVTAVNDVPSFSLSTTTVTSLEDAGAQTVTGVATGISAGASNESAQTLNFIVTTNNPSLFSVGPAIDPITGNLTYTAAANANGTATVSIQLHDNAGTANGGVDTSAIQTLTINVTAVNDVPSFSLSTTSVTSLEDAGAQTVTGVATGISAGASNESDQTLNFIVTSNNPSLFSAGPAIDPITGNLTYTAAANANGTATVSIQLHDNAGTANGGVDTSAIQTLTINVTAVNDVPSFSLSTTTVTSLEDAGAQTVTGVATGMSAGPSNESAQALNFIVTTNNPSLFSAGPSIDPITGNLTYTAAANANGSATVSIQLHDNGGTTNGGVDTSAIQTLTINVTAVNDVPSFSLSTTTVTSLEDAGAQTVTGVATGISAGPSNESSQTLNFIVTTNNPSLFSAGPAIDPITGNLTYTAVANANGTATVSIQLHDNGGTTNGGVDTSAIQTLTINVTAVNDVPSFSLSTTTVTSLEDAGAQTVSGVATGMSAGPTNESAQTLNFIVTTNNPSLFSAGPSIDPITGNLTYTAAANANGTATVSIQLHDNGGTTNGGVDTSAIQTLTINVTAVNDVPSFALSTTTINSLEDAGAQTVTGVATGMSAGPSNESSQTLNFIITTDNPSLFSVGPSIDPITGNLTYTAAANANGTATVSIQLHDNGGVANGGVDTSAIQTVTINVGAVNYAPSFSLSTATVTSLEDAGSQTVSGVATAISAGPPNESSQVLNFIVTTDNPSLFSVGPSIDPITGNLTYTAAANANGTATVSIQLHDSGGTANGGVDTSPVQTLTINVTAVNDVPSFSLVTTTVTSLEDAGAQTVTGVATGMSAGPSNESSQALNFIVTTNNPSLFSVGPAIDPITGNLTYTAAANANGTATVSIQLHDNGGTTNSGVDTSAVQTLTINVTAVNDVPSFSLATTTITSLEDAGAQTVTGVATGMSAGPSNESLQALNFIVTSNNPSLFSAGPSIDPITGNLTYTAAANANGTATVSIQLHDNAGTANGGVDTSAIQTLTINITAVNDVPSFSLSTTTVTSLEDAGAQTVTGVATGMSAGPSNESSQTLNFIVTTNNPSLFSVGPSIDPITGNLTYTAAANANGTATVSIQLHDNAGNANGGVDTSAIQTLTINVTAVNDVPSFSLSTTTITSLEDAGAQTVTGVATGMSAGASNESSQTLNFIVTTNNPSLFSAGPAIDPITGNLTYTAVANANGTATVSIQLHDTGGTTNGGVDTSAIQTLTINVTAVNDVPSFSLSTTTINSLEDAGAQTVTGVATGISAGPSNESSQALNFIVTTNNPSLFSAGPAIDPITGNLTYTAAANANGTATVSIQLHDNAGTTNGGVDTSAIQTLTINVTAVNDVPSFSLSTTTVTSLEDAGAQTVTGVGTGMSAGPSNESSQALNFIVTTNNPSLFIAGPAIDPVTGNLTYTAAANANGTATVSIQLHDNGGTTNSGVDTSAIQTLTINVTAVNDVPSFSLSTTSVTSLEDVGPQTVTGVATGMSAGASNESSQTLNFIVTTNNPSLFSAGPAIDPITGNLTYTAAANANGTATVSIQLHDNAGTTNGGVDTSAIQTLTINVTAVNDVPSFSLSTTTITSLEDAGAQTVTGVATGMSAGPSNESSQALNFIVTTNNPSLFSVGPSIDPITGNLTYTAAANANGTATVSIQLHDNGGATNGGVDTSAIQTLTINVTAVNDVPSFSLTTTSVTSLEDVGPQTVSGVATGISTGPSNESSQALNFIVTTNNPSLFSAGPAIDPVTGNLTYTAAANANGTATVSIQLHDNAGTTNGGVDTSAIQTLTINVTAVNDVPSFSLSTTTVTSLEDAGAQTVTGVATGMSAGPSNESSQALNFIVTTNNPSLFSVGPSIDPITGNLTYTAAANANGTATVSIQLHDNGSTANGGVDTSAVQTLTINVTAVNDVPSFSLATTTITSLEDAGTQTVTGVATGMSAGASNESSQALNFIVTTDNPGLFNVGPSIDPVTGNLIYRAAANANGTATVSIQLHDNGGTTNSGVDTSAIKTLTINVTAVNDVPSFSLTTTAVTSLEDAGPQTVTGVVTGMSTGPSDESSQTMNLIVTTDNPGLFTVVPTIDPITGDLTYTSAPNTNGTATVSIQLHDSGGSANGGVDTSAIKTLVIHVTPTTPTVVAAPPLLDKGEETLPNPLRAILALDPSSLLFHPNEPFSSIFSSNDYGLNSFGFHINGDTSKIPFMDIGVTPVNNAPTFTLAISTVTSMEGAGPQSIIGVVTDMSAGPASEADQALSFIVTNNNPALFIVAPSINPETGTLTYVAAPNAHGTVTVQITLMDSGGTANGGINVSTTQTLIIIITPGPNATSFEDRGLQTLPSFIVSGSSGPSNESEQLLDYLVSNDNGGLFSVQPYVDNNGALHHQAKPHTNGHTNVQVALHDNGGSANGDIDTGAIQMFTVDITSANEGLKFIMGDDQTVSAGSGAHTVTGFISHDSLNSANKSGEVLTYIVTNNNNALFSVQPFINAIGTLQYTLAGTSIGTATVQVVFLQSGGMANGDINTSIAQTFKIKSQTDSSS